MHEVAAPRLTLRVVRVKSAPCRPRSSQLGHRGRSHEKDRYAPNVNRESPLHSVVDRPGGPRKQISPGARYWRKVSTSNDHAITGEFVSGRAVSLPGCPGSPPAAPPAAAAARSAFPPLAAGAG